MAKNKNGGGNGIKNSNLIGAGKQFKAVRDSNNNIQWAKSFQKQGKSSSSRQRKHLPKIQLLNYQPVSRLRQKP